MKSMDPEMLVNAWNCVVSSNSQRLTEELVKIAKTTNVTSVARTDAAITEAFCRLFAGLKASPLSKEETFAFIKSLEDVIREYPTKGLDKREKLALKFYDHRISRLRATVKTLFEGKKVISGSQLLGITNGIHDGNERSAVARRLREARV